MKNIFFKILLITLLFSFSYSASQNIDNYINGYKEGFRVGYCQSELPCSAPIPNSQSIFIGDRPLQYPVGYGQGLEAGKIKRINDNKNKSTLAAAIVKAFKGDLVGSKDPMTTRNRVKKPEPGLYVSAEEYYENGLDKMFSYDEYGNGPSKQDFIRAIEDFTKAIEINPSYWDAFFRRGMAKANINDNEGAIEDFTIIITYDFDKRSIRRAKGWIRTLKKI